MTKIELYRLAIKKWGESSQILMMVEEIGELLQVISKYNRNPTSELSDKIAEEIADVEIMLEQLKEMIFCWDRVEERKKYKLNRLEKLLGETNEPAGK